MSKELTALVNTIEYTDEMIQLQKDYEKLNRISDLLEEADDLLTDLFDMKPVCSNQEVVDLFKKRKRLDRIKANEILEKLKTQVDNESWAISLKVNELFGFQKLGNALSIYKILKDENKNEDPY